MQNTPEIRSRGAATIHPVRYLLKRSPLPKSDCFSWIREQNRYLTGRGCSAMRRWTFTRPSKLTNQPLKINAKLSKNLEMILELWQNETLNGTIGEGSKTGDQAPVLFRQRGEIYRASGNRGSEIECAQCPARMNAGVHPFQMFPGIDVLRNRVFLWGSCFSSGIFWPRSREDKPVPPRQGLESTRSSKTPGGETGRFLRFDADEIAVRSQDNKVSVKYSSRSSWKRLEANFREKNRRKASIRCPAGNSQEIFTSFRPQKLRSEAH